MQIENDFVRYQQLAQITNGMKNVAKIHRLTVAALGLGEAGEFQNIIKKVLAHGHPLDEATTNKLIDEAGDILWYLQEVADALGISLRTIADRNITKLKARYPDGFSSEASINRKE